jgi:predicted DNA-binding protein YlxM (UPF0122 family)
MENKKQRDAEVCAYYLGKHSVAECARKFALSRQRVHQILKKGEAWHPPEKSDRTEFLGVTIDEPTKDALKKEAEEKGISVSKLVSDKLAAGAAE